jgi:hypothetical protein
MFVPKKETQKKGSAPRYIVAYSSLVTLLLAFFITLQSLATERNAAAYQAGRGSFIYRLKTFGLGGILHIPPGDVVPGSAGPRYGAPEEEAGPPPEGRRIDAEQEEAEQALKELQDRFAVQEPEQAIGYRIEFPIPCTYSPGKEQLTGEEQQFLRDLAARLERVVLARKFVVRVGAILHAAGDATPEQMGAALAAAGKVRAQIIASMGTAAQETAARRLYSYARTDRSDRRGAAEPGVALKLEILLTKPYARQLKDRGASASGNST